MVGNTLQWYDYALYGYFASVISDLFFPLKNEYLSLIAAFGVFAAGFIMRPVGAILFGYIGDKYGRRLALSSAVLLMAVPTSCIGLLPTYEDIGIIAPLLLIVIRLIQGLALGGEFSGSMTFIIEHSPDNKHGIVGSSSMFSMVLGMLLGSFVAAFTAGVLTPEDFKTWGWRIPFLISLPAGIIGLYIRTQLQESPKYEKLKLENGLSVKPLREVIMHHWKEVIIVIGIVLSLTVPFYTLTVFMNSFLVKILNHSIHNATIMNTINMLVLMIFIPISAIVSDKIGRKNVLIAVTIGYILFTYPIFLLLVQDGFIKPLLAQIAFSILVGCFIGPLPAMMVETFPTKVCYTGTALSYNFSIAIFGGTAPAISTWLIKSTELNSIVALYIILYAIVSLIALCCYKGESTAK